MMVGKWDLESYGTQTRRTGEGNCRVAREMVTADDARTRDDDVATAKLPAGTRGDEKGDAAGRILPAGRDVFDWPA